jgi:hypothetical protein
MLESSVRQDGAYGLPVRALIGESFAVCQTRKHERAMAAGKSLPVHDGTMVEQKFHKRLPYVRRLRMNAGLI